MRHSARMEKGILYTAAVLLCLVLVSFWMMSNILARYTSTGAGTDSARVAAYVFDLKDQNEGASFNLSEIKIPGDSTEYEFQVTNKSEGKISEVAQQYKIQLAVDGNVPLQCTVTKQENNAEKTVCTAKNIVEGEQKNISDSVTIAAAADYTQTYKLTVQWPEKYNDETYAVTGGTSTVTLTVQAEQID